jgi:hypothetical protein
VSSNLQTCHCDACDLCLHFWQSFPTSHFRIAICKGCLSGIGLCISPLLRYITKAWITGDLWPLFSTPQTEQSGISWSTFTFLADLLKPLQVWGGRCVFIALLPILPIHHTFTNSTGLPIRCLHVLHMDLPNQMLLCNS